MPSPGQPNCGTTGLRCVKTTISVLGLFISTFAFAQQTTQLAATSCGSTVDLTTDLTADPVNGASKYEFRIENASLGYAQTIEKSSNRFKMFELIPTATDQQTYEVSVRVKKGNAYGTFGPKCNVQLNDHQKTKLSHPDCGRGHVLGATVLTADPIQGATQYEFKVENTALGFSETIIKSTNEFSLDELSGTITAGASYQVSVKTEKGGQWNAWGQECVIEAFGLGSTKLLPPYCGATDVGSTDVLKFAPVAFATSYMVLAQINTFDDQNYVPVTLTDEIQITTNQFSLQDFTLLNYRYGTTYEITIIPLAGNLIGSDRSALCMVSSQSSTITDTLNHLDPICIREDCNMISNGGFEGNGGFAYPFYNPLTDTYHVDCWASGFGSADISVVAYTGAYGAHAWNKGPNNGESILKTLHPGEFFESGTVYLLDYHSNMTSIENLIHTEHVNLANSTTSGMPSILLAGGGSPVPTFPSNSEIYKAQTTPGQFSQWRQHTTFFKPTIDYDQIVFYPLLNPNSTMINSFVTGYYDDISVTPLIMDTLETCANKPVQLGPSCPLTIPNDMDVQFLWSPSAGLSDPAILDPWATTDQDQEYTLSIILYGDPNINYPFPPETLTTTQWVDVKESNAYISAAPDFCSTGSTILTLHNPDYPNWTSLLGGQIDSVTWYYEKLISSKIIAVDTFSVEVFDPGTYYVRYYDDATSCTYVLSYEVGVYKEEFGVIGPISIDPCFDTIVMLTVNNLTLSDSIYWNGPNGFISIADTIYVPIADTGLYTASFQSQHCGWIADEFYLTTTNPYRFQIRTPDGIVLCDSSVTLTSNAPENYTNYQIWVGNNGFSGNGFSVEVTQPGLYYATLITTTGCVYRDSIRVIPCCTVDPNYMIVLSGGTYSPGAGGGSMDLVHILVNNPGIRNIAVTGNVVLSGYTNYYFPKLDGYTIHMTQGGTTITLDDSPFEMRNSTVKSSCTSMWGGFVVHNNYWTSATDITPSEQFKLENCRVEDAIKAVYVQADMTMLGDIYSNHYNEPNNGINEIKIMDSRFVNNLQNIVIDNVNTCPEGTNNVCGIRMAQIENNLFGLDGGLNLPPYAGYISKNHIEIGYVNETNFDTDITVKGNIFEDCIKAIELTNYYDNNGYTDIEDGSINIEEGNVFNRFYEGAIDLGSGGEESQFKMKNSQFNFANITLNPAQASMYSGNSVGLKGNIRAYFEVVDCDFNGTEFSIQPQIGVNNESGCGNTLIVGNSFQQLSTGLDIMVYGYETNGGDVKFSTTDIEENVFNKNGVGINFKENMVWTYTNFMDILSTVPATIITDINCNNFIEGSPGQNTIGIKVENGGYMGNIGDCASDRPSGNGWPVESRMVFSDISTWTSPSNWVSIENLSSASFDYYPYVNEFVADGNSYIGISDPYTVGQNSCLTDTAYTGSTCGDTSIIFPTIVSNPNNSGGDDNGIHLGNGYPNPSSGLITIPYKVEDEYDAIEIQILNIVGSRVLQRRNVTASQGEVNFNLSNYPNGTYIYRIEVDGVVRKSRIVGIVK